MNGITFTGIRNIGGCCMSTQIARSPKLNMRTSLIMQLADDFNGQDLTEFREAVKKANDARWFKSFPEDNRILHIMTAQEHDLIEEYKETVPRLYLNYVPVPVKRETLGLFTHIAKLTKSIIGMQDNEFKCASDFKYGPIGRYGIAPFHDMLKVAQGLNIDFMNFMDEYVFSAFCSKNGAKVINENIGKQMTDYLC